MAVILAWIRSKTRLTKFGVISVFWFTLFVIQMFNNLLEALFFTNVFPSTKEFVEAIYVSMLTVLVEAFMAGVLFTSKKADLSLSSALHGYFDRRSRFSWSWRITAASLAYFPIYLFFGMLASPFIISYYMGAIARPQATAVHRDRSPRISTRLPLRYISTTYTSIHQ